LAGTDGEKLPARNLYAGQHWTAVQSLTQPGQQAGFDVRLWIASAGYGLIPEEAEVHPYSATFDLVSPDSVVIDRRNAGAEARAWWTALAAHRGLVDAPRSVAELAEREPAARILVVASPRYVGAMHRDLLETARRLRSSEHLIIVSSPGTGAAGALKNHWIESVARLQQKLGGARISLHARVAKRILQEARTHPLEASALKARYQRLVARAPAEPPLNRVPMSDDEVRDFIRATFRKQGPVTYSRLLRQLRQSGQACEQKRFKGLYERLRGEDGL
jgi:hypothetical protein